MDVTSLAMIGAGAAAATYCFFSASDMRKAGKLTHATVRTGLGAALALITAVNTTEYVLASRDYGTILRSAYDRAASDMEDAVQIPDPEQGMGSRAEAYQVYDRS